MRAARTAPCGSFGSGPPVCDGDPRLAVLPPRSRRAAKLGLGESYTAGEWDSRRPGRAVRAAAPQRRQRGSPTSLALRRLLEPRPRLNRRNGLLARAAEHRLPLRPRQRALRLMLDETMTYSCAVFERAGRAARGRSAAQATAAICEKLELGPTTTCSRSAAAGAGSRAFAAERVRRTRHRPHDLGRAGRDGARAARPASRPCRILEAGLPDARGQLHEDRVDRDAGGDRRAPVPDVLRRRSTACSRRAAWPASRRSSSPTSAGTATGRRRTGSSATSSPAA